MKPRLSQLAQTGATDGQVATWSASLGLWVPATPGTAYTDEMARDAIGAALVAGAGISIVVNDPADTITVSATGGGSPSFVGARAVLTSAITLTSGVVTTVDLTTETYDSGSLHDNTTNPSRITVPVAGKYLCIAYASHASTAGQVQVRILKNGSVDDINIDNGNSGGTTPTATDIVDCAAGDYIQMAVYQSSGSNAQLNGAYLAVGLMGT